MKHFFISYNSQDKQWAEWIAWTLEEAGYTAVIQAWDFRPGGNFVLDMQRASAECEKTIAVLSANYLQSEYAQSEWSAAFAGDPLSLKRKLIPVRVGVCKPEGVLKTVVYVDLVGVTEPALAKQRVLDALKARAKPDQEPTFPGAVPTRERTEPEPVAFPPTEKVAAKAEPEPQPQPRRPLPVLKSFQFDVITVNARVLESDRRKGQFFTEDLGGRIGLELVAIPSGRFLMGSPTKEGWDYEQPQHWVTLPPFFMGKYPVTQAQWRAVAALPKRKLDLAPDPSYFKGSKRPVEQVSWDKAVEFCDRLSQRTGRAYRLPSEAEWEYACRAGTTTSFHFGEVLMTSLANYNGRSIYSIYSKKLTVESRDQTTDVGTFPANAFGLYDMHGNVWEWCLDYWHSNYQGAPTDGSAWIADGDSKYRLLRGGSWDYVPRDCRSAIRLRYMLDLHSNDSGFRVVCHAT